MADEVTTACNTLKSASGDLLKRSNVVATGVGYKVTNGNRTETPSIICSVVRKLPPAQLSASDRVPETVSGIPSDVIETGRIRALQARTDRQRPAPGGVSIGHTDITAGTLGCLVKRGSEILILSNNHVIANSNDAERGDTILQPGPADGGRNPADKIAELEDFVEITFNTPEPPSDCQFASGVIALLNAGCSTIGSRTRYRIVRPQMEPNLVDAAIVRLCFDCPVRQQSLYFGREQELVTLTRPEDWNDSQPVSSNDQDTFSRIPNCKNKHSVQFIQYLCTIFFVPMNEYFRI